MRGRETTLEVGFRKSGHSPNTRKMDGLNIVQHNPDGSFYAEFTAEHMAKAERKAKKIGAKFRRALERLADDKFEGKKIKLSAIIDQIQDHYMAQGDGNYWATIPHRLIVAEIGAVIEDLFYQRPSPDWFHTRLTGIRMLVVASEPELGPTSAIMI